MPMPKRKRDYRAEERRRNELARALGFKNRAELRKAIETGVRPARRVKQLRKPSTIAAQARLRKSAKPSTYDEIVATYSDQQRSQEWGWLLSKHETAEYEARGDSAVAKQKRAFIQKHGKDVYTRAYLEAWAEGDEKYYRVRYRGGSYALGFWLVEVCGYLTWDQFWERYGAK